MFIVQSLSGQIITNYYDNLGRITQTAYPDSCTIYYSYDASGNRLTKKVTNICFTKPKPVITIIGSTIFCSNDSVVLSASGSAPYIWSNGATTQSIVVRQAGQYFVTTNY